jgi:hypothetical protein
VLNNKRLEAAKRAAIITTALQWLLGQVPLSVLPPQFRPGLLVAQRLVPYIGYIGGFVAWSWGAMKSFDKGTWNVDLLEPEPTAIRSRHRLDCDLAFTCRAHSWNVGGLTQFHNLSSTLAQRDIGHPHKHTAVEAGS